MALETATRLARWKEVVILPRWRSHLGHRSLRYQALSVADDFQEEYKAGRFYAEEDPDVSKFNLHWDPA